MAYKYGHWLSGKKLNPEVAAGFVYLIYNERRNMFYIGKKFYRNRKGKNKGKAHSWENYTSSSVTLNEDIKAIGKENFKFFIISEYNSLAALSWAETWSLVNQLIPERNDLWYNRHIDKVRWEVKEVIPEYHKTRLDYLVKKYNNKNKEKVK
jgi:hypothetical protein